ncbi:TonB-dependent receptor [Aquabacterium sp. OR-4]|uniref:TonB-dependent receptor n=1 Tax=Aquabacterium sp. OR-4 TaxID=2978127 RepID=UPI0021B22316|nr:TonB-dependent receptor [Aquabacterium sp. OR-4]MDT7834207.1 TonB-dependent receptor [Aquabacterium sp. OR-4]
MTTSIRRARSGRGQAGFQVRPVAVGCAMLLLGASELAMAQQASQEVVVTGIRRGIESAISVKKNADGIVEAVSAEDIGKLPDSSIAEALARLPGLTAQRVNGRAQEIQVRGLAGQFASTLLNGREQVSTGDNRAAEFDQYPSELLGGVSIYKTPYANLVGQGLSGTIDLQTVRPLNFASRSIAVNLRGERNSMGSLNDGGSGANGSRFSASYIDQFANRTIGVALGYARLDSPNQNQYYRSWGYPSGSGTIGATTYNDVRLPGGIQVRAESAEQVRDGLMAVLQYKPNKDFESLVDLYYSKFEKTALQRGFESGLAWSGATLTNPKVSGATQTAPNTYSGGVLTSADYVGVKPVFRHDLNTREDEIKAIGWNNKLKLAGWTATTDLSWSKATRSESILELYSGTVPGSTGATDTFTVNLPDGGGVPSIRAGLNYADPSIIRLVDSGGWGQAGYLKQPKVSDELKSVRMGLQRDVSAGFVSRIDLGANYTEREKSRDVPEFFTDLKAAPTTVPASMLRGSTSLAFVGIPSMLSYDPAQALAQLYTLRANVNNADIINKQWTVREKISTGYLKADIDTEVMGKGLRGNAGVQVVHTNQSSTAYDVDLSDRSKQRQQTAGTTYTDVLPSLNLALSLNESQVVRLGMAKQMARPRMDDMRATRKFDVDTSRVPTVWTGDGGNPELKPWRADALDLSFEQYFGNKGYVALAGYYKDLKSYIYKQKVPRSFAGVTVPTGKTAPTSDIGLFEQPANGSGGSISGAEFSLSVPLSMLSKSLDGFGVVYTASVTESQIQPFGPGDTRPLPGLSKKVWNLTGYYEKYGFSARASYRYRGPYVAEVTGFGADRAFEYAKAESIVDLQLGYEFSSGPAKGLSLLVQVNNATNEPYEEYYNNDPTQVRQNTKYGRTMLFGINYKM